jgi:hypothetical protein
MSNLFYYVAPPHVLFSDPTVEKTAINGKLRFSADQKEQWIE